MTNLLRHAPAKSCWLTNVSSLFGCRFPTSPHSIPNSALPCVFLVLPWYTGHHHHQLNHIGPHSLEFGVEANSPVGHQRPGSGGPHCSIHSITCTGSMYTQTHRHTYVHHTHTHTRMHAWTHTHIRAHTHHYGCNPHHI